MLAAGALEEFATVQPAEVLVPAREADKAIRPTCLEQRLCALLFGAEMAKKIGKPEAFLKLNCVAWKI